MEQEIPPGFALNSPEQKEALRAVMMAVVEHLNGVVPAVAVVVAMPDGTVSAGLAGDLADGHAFSKLLATGSEVLRHTIQRFLAGKGDTSVINLAK